MIYWLLYNPGVGGDGIANLLEFADGIEPVDGIRTWRYDINENGKLKFKMRRWVEPLNWFRSPWKIKNIEDTELTPWFKERYDKGISMVLPVHHQHYNDTMHLFKFKHLFTSENTKKICLYSTDTDRVMSDLESKVPEITSEWIEKHRILAENLNSKFLDLDDPIQNEFDVLIDIERVWKDWDYFNEKLQSIGIDLPRQYYEEYLDVSKRR